MAWYRCGNSNIGNIALLPERLNADSQTITASSYEGSYPPWFAFSFNSSTSWRAGRDDSTPWIACDLGEVKQIIETRFIVINDLSGEFSAPIYIEGSNDGETWANIIKDSSSVTLSVQGPNIPMEKYFRLDGQCRYIRMRSTQNFTVWGGQSCWFSDIAYFSIE